MKMHFITFCVIALPILIALDIAYIVFVKRYTLPWWVTFLKKVFPGSTLNPFSVPKFYEPDHHTCDGCIDRKGVVADYEEYLVVCKDQGEVPQPFSDVQNRLERANSAWWRGEERRRKEVWENGQRRYDEYCRRTDRPVGFMDFLRNPQRYENAVTELYADSRHKSEMEV